MGLIDFFSGGKNKIDSVDDSSAVKNQILQTPNNFLDSFKTENFGNLSVQERMNAYQNLENEMARQEHRMPREVVFDSEASLPYDSNGHMPKGCGYYTSDDDKIHMNPYYLTDQCARNGGQFDGMDTVIHEGRHAYHYDCINGYIDKPDDDFVNNQEGIKKSYYKGVYGEAKSPDNITGINNYSNIACEHDTFSFAFNKMNSDQFSSVFAGDKNYENYINAQKNFLSQQQYEAYFNGASHNLLENNPEFKDRFENNLNSGMTPKDAMKNSYEGDFENDVINEINSISSKYPPDEYSSRYMDELAEKHGNIPPSETIAQSATQSHDINTYRPQPTNYSFVSDNNPNGYLIDTDDVVGKGNYIAKQEEPHQINNNEIDKGSNDINFDKAEGLPNEAAKQTSQNNGYTNDQFFESELADYNDNQSLSNGNNYYDDSEDIGYSPMKSYGHDTNNYPDSPEEYSPPVNIGNNEQNTPDINSTENQDVFTPNYVDFDLDNSGDIGEKSVLPNDQPEQGNNAQYADADQENGVNQSEEQGLPNEQPEQGNNAQYADADQENGVKPSEEQGLPNNQPEQGNNAQYADADQENGAKPSEEQGLPNNQPEQGNNAQYADADQENGAKPSEEQGLPNNQPEQGNNAQYADADQENGAKPSEEQGLPNNQPEQGSSNSQSSDLDQENGAKPDEEQNLPEGNNENNNVNNQNIGDNAAEVSENTADNAAENAADNAESVSSGVSMGM